MEKIDWDKSTPEYPLWIEYLKKATDADPLRMEAGGIWAVDKGDRYETARGTFWSKPEDGYYRVHERPSSPAWSGEGNPPQGILCEYSIGEPSWFPCEIRYVLDCDHDPDADGWGAVIWCPHLEKEQFAGRHFKFRAVRTPEQIAADEREAAVEEMLLLDPYLPNTTLGMMSRADFCRTLHDAGYRKVEPSK